MVKRLVAMTCALVVATGACCAYAASSGFDGLGIGDLQVTYPDYDEVSNWDFMTAQYDALADAGMNPELVLGSSELKSAPAGAAHPGRLFSDGRFGHTALIAGRAGCNDLWQAIELGAFSNRLPEGRKRAVVFVSMQWFMCYRDPAQSFPGVFSQGAYDAFMANGEIPDELKARVAQRVRAYGVDAELSSDSLAHAIECVDREAVWFVDNLRLGRKLRAAAQGVGGEDGKDAGVGAEGGSTRGANVAVGDAGAVDAAAPVSAAGSDAAAGSAVGGAADPVTSDAAATPNSGAPAAPDWDAIVAESEAEARRNSTNEYGFADAWYEKKFERWLSGAQKSWRVEDGAYFSQQELEDFELMLEVCRACGIEPLIVIQPVKGAAYDQTIYTREVREQYYDMIRQVCAEAGARVADFSEYEYDTYFLRDYSHPSPLGSAYYSKAIYEFWEEGDR